MLDSDIAKLYQVETKRVNEAVKNNPEKFLERFSFVLTNEEVFIDSKMEMDILLELYRIVYMLTEKYNSLDEYFADENRIHFPEYAEYIS